MPRSPISVETTCRQCGVVITPSADEIRRGPAVWRYCRLCRPLDGPSRPR
jgi:hypothetical protein